MHQFYSDENLTCTLTLRAIQDVNKLIHEKERRDCPLVCRLQFDNASNNKSHGVNMFCSLIIELKVFEEIFVQYLIAGN